MEYRYKISDCLPVLNKPVSIVKKDTLIGELCIRNNKLFWKIKNEGSQSKFIKYKFIKVENTDLWEYYDINSFIDNVSISQMLSFTDKLVGLLHTTYTSFGLQMEHSYKTDDGLFEVLGIWGSVSVRLFKETPILNYNNLLKKLRDYYRDKNVIDIYICVGGYIIIKVNEVNLK